MPVYGNMEPSYSVIYSRFLNAGVPQPIEQPVADWLTSSGIRKILVGHAPHGDLPLIMDYLGVQVITADSSYSRFVRWNIEDLRRIPAFKEMLKWSRLSHWFQPNWITVDQLIDCYHQYLNEPSHSTTVEGKLLSEEMERLLTKDFHFNSLFEQTMKEKMTRSPFVRNEILLQFPAPAERRENDNDQQDESNNRAPLSSVIISHGVSSLNIPYHSSIEGIDNNSYVGKCTRKSGWYVKASDIEIPGGLSGEKYFLLCWSCGYLLLDRFVTLEELLSLF
jgi:hypothetical protein